MVSRGDVSTPVCRPGGQGPHAVTRTDSLQQPIRQVYQVSNVLEAIDACRNLVRQFLAGSLDYGTFKARMASAMGPLDPLDSAVESLAPDQQKEAAFYVEWTGGEFGETDLTLPRLRGHGVWWMSRSCSAVASRRRSSRISSASALTTPL